MLIGNKIRNYRQNTGMTIPQLAEKTELSRGFISQVENNKVSLSLDSLQKIASALNVPVKNFLEEQIIKPEVVRKDKRPVIKLDEESEIEILSAPFGHDLQVVIVDLKADYQTGNNTHTHDGEEFITVLKGRVKVVQGEFSTVLCEGDSIHIDSTYPHLCQNIESEPVRIMVALTPPALLPITKIEDN
ncbi:MAG: XRE family transcriptional regulator [Clostridium sp.]|nr:XRE family transcriptional regulator [Clostridium sp.]